VDRFDAGHVFPALEQPSFGPHAQGRLNNFVIGRNCGAAGLAFGFWTLGAVRRMVHSRLFLHLAEAGQMARMSPE
jgi:hypothetical protein